MTVPINIPETPLVHAKPKSFQGSKGGKISISKEVFQHVLKKIMDIQDDEEVESFYQWMSFRGLFNITDVCETYNHILHTMQDHHDYKLNGIRCSITNSECSSSGCQQNQQMMISSYMMTFSSP